MSARNILYLVEFLALFGVWLSVALTYHFMSGGRWRRSTEGQHVMALAVIMSWNSGLVITNILFRDYPFRAWIGGLSYAMFVGYGAWRLAMIVKAQRERRRRQWDSAASALSRSAAEPPR